MRTLTIQLTLAATLLASLCVLPNTADAGPFRRDRGYYETDYVSPAYAYPANAGCDCCGNGGYSTNMLVGSSMRTYYSYPGYYSYYYPNNYYPNYSTRAYTYGYPTYNYPLTYSANNQPSTSLYSPNTTTGTGNTGDNIPSPMLSREVTKVTFTDNSLDPMNLTISTGTTVRWINDGKQPQTVTSIKGDFDSGDILPGKEYKAQFTKPGLFEYTSKYQKDLKGTIVVK